MHSVCRCGPPVCGYLKKETPVIYFSPAPDGYGLKQQHLYGTISTSSLPSFIKIHQAVLEKNLKMWKVYKRAGGWTENGRRDMTIADLSLRLRWAKSRQIKLMEDSKGFYTKSKCELHPFNTLIYQYLMIHLLYSVFLLRNKYFIPTKFHQNPSSGSEEEFENVKSLQTDGRVDGKRTARYNNRLKLSFSIFHFHIKIGKRIGQKFNNIKCAPSLQHCEPSASCAFGAGEL